MFNLILFDGDSPSVMNFNGLAHKFDEVIGVIEVIDHSREGVYYRDTVGLCER